MKLVGHFDYYGLDELFEQFERFENELPVMICEIIGDVGVKAVRYAQNCLGVSVSGLGTGRLKESIMYRIDAIDDGLKLVVFANREYGIYVEYGTGTAGDPSVAHVNASTWVYYDDERGFITAHAQPPRPFMYPAFVYTVDLLRGGEMQRLLSERICELLNNGE